MFHLPLAGDGGVAPDTTLGKADQPIEVEPIGKAVTAVLLDLLPWGLAVLLHAAVILLSIFVVWQVGTAQANMRGGADLPELRPSGGDRGAPVVPDPLVVPTRKPNGPDNPLIPHSPVRPNPPGGPNRPPTPSGPVPTLSGEKPTPFRIIGPGPEGGGIFPALPSVGPARPGNPDGPANDQPRGDITGGGHLHLAFIIDGSGALIEGMPFVIDQLKVFVNDLGPDQEFAIFFFQGDKVKQVVDGKIRDVNEHAGFIAGTPFNKSRACEALDEVRPEGVSNPAKAIQVAFSDRYPPNVVYILSQNITGTGQYELRRETLLAAVEKYNGPEGKIAREPTPKREGQRVPPAVINAIQYLYPDPLQQQGFTKATLEDLVDQNNARIAEYWKKWYPQEDPPQGRYKYVDATALLGTN
jgi:hypothetical protein